MNKKSWYEDYLKEAEDAGFHHEQDSDRPAPEQGGSLNLVHENGITHIWQILEGWQVAEYIEGYAQNHRPHEELTEALKDLPKTLKGWHESNVQLTSYLDEGDAVTLDIIDEMTGVVPPETFFNDKFKSGEIQGCLQVGEPYDHKNGEARYITFYRKVTLTKASDCWRYAGIKPKWRG